MPQARCNMVSICGKLGRGRDGTYTPVAAVSGAALNNKQLVMWQTPISNFQKRAYAKGLARSRKTGLGSKSIGALVRLGGGGSHGDAGGEGGQDGGKLHFDDFWKCLELC